MYLNASLVASLLLPLISFPESIPAPPVMYEVNAAVSTVKFQSQPVDIAFSWPDWLRIIYLCGAFVALAGFLEKLNDLIKFIRNGEIVRLEDFSLSIIDKNEVGSFSFFRWVVINRRDYEQNFDAILRHELVHVSQYHSMDIILIELLKIVFWFNPILILYKNALQEVHEFLADEKASDRENYAHFLLVYAFGAPAATLSNHFFKTSQIKNRIKMIYQERSSNWFKSTYVVALILMGAIALLVAGCEKARNNSSEQTSGNSEMLDSTKILEINGYVTDIEDKQPLPGVNVVVQNKYSGTTTDSDGGFVINAPATGVLEISFVGYKTQTRQIRGVSDHIIALKRDATYENGINKEQSDQTAESGENMPNAYRPNGYDSQAVVKPDAKMQRMPNPHRKAEVIPAPKDGPIFSVVDQQPSFPGGVGAMYQFISKTMVYPQAARRAQVSGRVYLSFVVGKIGKISNIELLKGIGFGCDEEAIRIVSLFPAWQPGKENSQPVNVKYNLPINFQMADAATTGK